MLDDLVERRIAEAISRGELDGLPGEGQPLELDDDSMVPPELRAAYRILKNSGHLPPELERLREFQLTRAMEQRGIKIDSPAVQAYRQRALEKLAGESRREGAPSQKSVRREGEPVQEAEPAERAQEADPAERASLRAMLHR